VSRYTPKKRTLGKAVAAGLLSATPLLALAGPASAQASGGSTEAAVQLIKEVEIAPGSWAEYKESPVGDTVNFRFSIINSGTADLVSVDLFDPSFPLCDTSSVDLGVTDASPLTPGMSVTATCTVAVGTNTINLANVVAVDADGNEVTDEDAAEVGVYCVDVIKDILNPATGSWDSGVGFEVGDTATFRFQVNNCGELSLFDVEVMDVNYPGCDLYIGDMPAADHGGETAVYLCDIVVNETIINQATVVGTTTGNALTSDTDYAGAYVRGLDLEKSVWDGDSWEDSAVISPGDETVWRFTVTNTGSMDLHGIEVVDEQFEQCDSGAGVVPTLAAGETFTYDCTIAGITGYTLNEASATGATVGNASGSFAGLAVSADDSAAVDVLYPTTTTAAPTTAAPTTAAPTTAAPTTAAPSTAAPTTAAPTTAAPTTAAPSTAAPTTAAPTTAAPTTAARTLPETGSNTTTDTSLIGTGAVLLGGAFMVTSRIAARREEDLAVIPAEVE
jgi:LPXTG-motif cell wall-anchored protein